MMMMMTPFESTSPLIKNREDLSQYIGKNTKTISLDEEFVQPSFPYLSSFRVDEIVKCFGVKREKHNDKGENIFAKYRLYFRVVMKRNGKEESLNIFVELVIKHAKNNTISFHSRYTHNYTDFLKSLRGFKSLSDKIDTKEKMGKKLILANVRVDAIPFTFLEIDFFKPFTQQQDQRINSLEIQDIDRIYYYDNTYDEGERTRTISLLVRTINDLYFEIFIKNNYEFSDRYSFAYYTSDPYIFLDECIKKFEKIIDIAPNLNLFESDGTKIRQSDIHYCASHIKSFKSCSPLIEIPSHFLDFEDYFKVVKYFNPLNSSDEILVRNFRGKEVDRVYYFEQEYDINDEEDYHRSYIHLYCRITNGINYIYFHIFCQKFNLCASEDYSAWYTHDPNVFFEKIIKKDIGNYQSILDIFNRDNVPLLVMET